MALVNILSYEILDDNNTPKSMPIHFPIGLTAAQIQSASDLYAPVIDAAIAGIISSVTLTLQLTLPGGLKSVVSESCDAERGALLGFRCANTRYRHSIFVPTWPDAGFSGDDVSGTFTAGNTLISDIESGLGTAALTPSDKYANDITTYLNDGFKAFRK